MAYWAVKPIGCSIAFGNCAAFQADNRGCLGDIAIKRVGGNEVHQRFRVHHVGAEVRPADITGQTNRFTEVIQGRQADVTATRDVDRRQVERLAQQAGVHCRREQFVNLIHLLMGQAQGNRGRTLFGEQCRVEEGLLQRHAHDFARDAAIRVEHVDGFTHRRVTEAEGGLRVFQRYR